MATIYPDFLYDPGTNPLVAIGIVFVSMLKIIAYFVIYIFPRPTEFWLMTIAIYYVILTILFVMLVPPSSKLTKKKKQDRIDELRNMRRPSTFMK